MVDNNTTKIIKNIRIGQETYDIISDTVVNMINNLEAQLVEINNTVAQKAQVQIITWEDSD